MSDLHIQTPGPQDTDLPPVGENAQAAMKPPALDSMREKSRAFRPLSHSSGRRNIGDIVYNPARYLGQFLNEGMQIGFIFMFKDKDGVVKISISSRADFQDEGRMTMLLAKGLKVPAHASRSLTNVVFSVIGTVDENGDHQAVLVARKFTAMNFHQTGARNLLDMTKQDENGQLVMLPDEEIRRLELQNLRRGNTDAYNQVRIAGLVVGHSVRNLDQSAQDETGKMPYIEIHLRQDNNPENIIPLRIVTSKVEMVSKLLDNCYLRPMSFVGAHKIERIPVYETDEDGSILKIDGMPVQKTDESGNLVWRYNSFIKVTQDPTEATPREILFLSTEFKIPDWVMSLVQKEQEEREKQKERRELRRQQVEAGGKEGSANPGIVSGEKAEQLAAAVSAGESVGDTNDF